MRAHGRNPHNDLRVNQGGMRMGELPARVGDRMKHADEPLCPHCGEDRPSMIDKGRTIWHCKVCGKSVKKGQSQWAKSIRSSLPPIPSSGC